jgi:hypothetical protein
LHSGTGERNVRCWGRCLEHVLIRVWMGIILGSDSGGRALWEGLGVGCNVVKKTFGVRTRGLLKIRIEWGGGDFMP